MLNKVSKAVAVLGVGMVVLTGCGNQVDRVTRNVSQDADNFKVDRRLVVVNTVTDQPLLEIVGRFAIDVDSSGNKLDVIVKEDEDTYRKHFVGLDAATVVYTIEDLSGAEVNPNRYQINYLPEAIIPIEVKRGSTGNEVD